MEKKQRMPRHSQTEEERFAVEDTTNLTLARQALSAEAMIGVTSQMVVEDLSGNNYEHLNISILPGSTTVIVGDNVKARNELAHDLGNPFEGSRISSIHLPKNSEVVYITPNISEDIDKGMTLKDFFLMARGIDHAEERLTQLWELASQGSESALKQAGELHQKFDDADGWTADQEIGQLLEGLSFDSDIRDSIPLDRKISELSSGQISKAIIGRGLYSKANILVMDNPSVHLDVTSKEWLATYIKQSPRAIIVATSDMLFAESIADRVIEILDSKLTLNIGTGLTNYYEERSRLITSWGGEAERAREAIKDLEIQIRDFFRPAAKRTDNMAQVLRAQMSKLERMKQEYSKMPGKIILETDNKRQITRQFETKTRSGADVISLKNLQVIYDSSKNGDCVVDIQSLDIHRQEKVALIGKNGSGKSTLMRILAGDSSQLIIDGDYKLGASVSVGYYSPTSEAEASGDPTLQSAISQFDTHSSGTLGYWGFTNREAFNTTVSQLQDSDELARFQMAILMAQKPNLLLLDEPTSYLTPSYQEKLIDALRDYDGTLIVISHSPEFLSKLNLGYRILMPEGKKENL